MYTQNSSDRKEKPQETVEDSEPQTPLSKNASAQPKQKRRHKKFLIFSSVLAVLIIVPILVAAWFGFVPGLSNLLGARTPKNLGVTWTAADLASYKAQTGTSFMDFANAPANPDKPGKRTIFADPKTVEQLGLTQSEITAAINSLNWELLPLTNVQVRLTPGTVEVSGNLKLDHAVDFVNFIGGVGYSSSDVQKAADWGSRFVNGAAVYAKGAASVTNNTLTLSMEKIQIGRFSPPMDIATKVIDTGGGNGLHNTKYLDTKSATFEQGKLVFSGTYPTTIYVKH